MYSMRNVIEKRFLILPNYENYDLSQDKSRVASD